MPCTGFENEEESSEVRDGLCVKFNRVLNTKFERGIKQYSDSSLQVSI